MIYCNLKGGLGNMFFQIAAAKSIAIDAGTDCSFPNLESQLHLINSDSVYNPKIKHALEYKTILKNLKSDRPDNRIPVHSFPFHYTQPQLLTDLVIDGFFQSEKYFAHNREEILNYLNFDGVAKIVDEKYGDLLNVKTTAIHVRRGDYVRHSNHHPVQTMDYFNKGIDVVKDNTDTFLVFSDDIEWCKEHFKVDNIIYIEDEKDYIEIYLMSLCDNDIIANSSFSWWGAWLNTKEDKVVIGPTKWFGPAINHNTDDILPESWIKM